MKNTYVDIFPNKIIFSKTNELNWLEAKITLTNITNKYVIFKVYITNTVIYSANPPTHFIMPNDSIGITFKRKGKVPSEQEQLKDKFLIVALTVDKPVSSAEEAKNLMKQINLKAETNQEIYLEPEFTQEPAMDPAPGRKTMEPTMGKGQGRLKIDETTPPCKAGLEDQVESPTVGMSSMQQQIEETKKGIEDSKKKTQEVENQIMRLENQLTNLNINTGLFESKERALDAGNKESNKRSNSYPVSFVLLLTLLGLTFGASVNKLF